MKEALHKFKDLLVPPKLSETETKSTDMDTETDGTHLEQIHTEEEEGVEKETSLEEVQPEFEPEVEPGVDEPLENGKKFVITEAELENVDSEVIEGGTGSEAEG